MAALFVATPVRAANRPIREADLSSCTANPRDCTRERSGVAVSQCPREVATSLPAQLNRPQECHREPRWMIRVAAALADELVLHRRTGWAMIERHACGRDARQLAPGA
jgi:hypothetical protein